MSKITSLVPPCPRAAPGEGHDWYVVSTVLDEVSLLLHCEHCGETGLVYEPSKEEWSAAFNAPTDPYRWHDASRVRVRLPS